MVRSSNISDVSKDDLIDLEGRIEKALKRQAEDIAIDVSELEKQIKGIQMQQHVDVSFCFYNYILIS